MRVAPFLALLALGCSEYALDHKPVPSDGPDLLLEPPSVDFGVVAPGEQVEAGFTLTNIGDLPLDLGPLTLSGASSFEVTEEASGTTLAPGDSVDGIVTYLPSASPEFAQIQIPSNDVDSPVTSLDLKGEIGIPGLVIEPMLIDFGLVDVGSDVSAIVTVSNNGNATADLTAAVTDDPAFTVVGWAPIQLGQGDSTTLEVHFVPTDSIAYDGVLSLTVADVGDAPITLLGIGGAPPEAICDVTPPFAALTVDEVTWIGSGSSDPGGRPLAYDWQLVSAPAGSGATLTGNAIDPDWEGFVPDLAGLYTAELTVTNDLGLTDTCEVTVDARDAMPTAVCSASPDPAEALYDEVTWSGAGSTDPDGGPLDYTWTLLSAPAGSAATISGATNTNPDRQMMPDMVGTYTAQLVVTNQLGVDSEPCVAEVEAIPAAELWIEMFWAHRGDDMDLHVVRAGGSLNTNQDCYFDNCLRGLSWAPTGVDGDPRLDADDVPGTGPENVNVNAPDNVVYHVWIHDFPQSNYTGANDVTVNVYMGGFLVWTDTRPISGEDRHEQFAEIDWATQTVTPR